MDALVSTWEERIARFDEIDREHRVREFRQQIPYEPLTGARCPGCGQRDHWFHSRHCTLECFICGKPALACPHPRCPAWRGRLPGTVEVERYGLSGLDELAHLIKQGVFVWDEWHDEWRRPATHCLNCRMPYPDFAHGVLESMARMLAQPLRDALDRHLGEHGCATLGHPGYVGGFLHCDEATRLFRLLPLEEQVILA